MRDDATTSTDIDRNFAPRPAADAHTYEVEGEAVVLLEDSGTLHVLNPTATVVWRCFDGTSSLAAIARDIAHVTEVDEDTVLAQVVDLAHDLADKGLLAGFEGQARAAVDAQRGENESASAILPTPAPPNT